MNETVGKEGSVRSREDNQSKNNCSCIVLKLKKKILKKGHVTSTYVMVQDSKNELDSD
jgi:hypothetical protein